MPSSDTRSKLNTQLERIGLNPDYHAFTNMSDGDLARYLERCRRHRMSAASPPEPSITAQSREELCRALTDLGIDLNDLAIGTLDDNQLAALLRMLQGEQFMSAARKRFSGTDTPPAPAPTPPADPKRAKAEATVDEAISRGKIQANDRNMWIGQLVKHHCAQWRFSAAGRSRYDELVADLMARPDGRFDPDAEFTQKAMGSTAAGRAMLAAADASRQGQTVRKFSRGAGSDDDAFVARALTATANGRRVLAASAA